MDSPLPSHTLLKSIILFFLIISFSYTCIHYSKCNTLFFSADVATDNKLKEIVVNQTNEWSKLMEKHKSEEWEMLKNHAAQAGEIFESIIVEVQQRQLKQLQLKFDKLVSLLNFSITYFFDICYEKRY